MNRTISILLSAAATILSCRDDVFNDVAPINARRDFILAGETGPGIFSRDLIPDWEAYAYGVAGDSICLDINGDFLKDVCIKYSTESASNRYIVQTTVVCINRSAVSIDPEMYNDSIHNYLQWSTTNTLLGFTKIDFATGDTTSSGAWISTTDNFLGIKMTTNGRITYGWVKMSLLVHPATAYVQKICVKEFAGQKIH